MFGSADLTGTGRASIGQQSRSVVAADGAADQQGGRQLSERVKRYQEYATEAGSLLELLPGYKPHSIDTGSPSAQEATLMRQLEQRVCSGLRTTPATLLGDYSQVNFFRESVCARPGSAKRSGTASRC